MIRFTTPAFASPTHTVPTFGRPRRGSPEYAARVRAQVARLAALQSAATAELLPGQSILVVAGCARVRALVRDSLLARPWVRVLESATVDEGEQCARTEQPRLVIVDTPERAVLESPAVQRAVLIVDRVPRSGEVPDSLVGLLARPLNAERVARQVLTLLRDD